MADPETDLHQRLAALHKKYGKDLPARIIRMRTLWIEVRENPADVDSFAEFHRVAHHFAGSGATFGYAALSEAAAELDGFIQSIVEADEPLTSDRHGHIETLLERVETSATSRGYAPMLAGRAVQPDLS